MSIKVTLEEYLAEKKLIDELYRKVYYYAKRRAYNKDKLDEWTEYYTRVRRQAIREKWTPQEFAEVDVWIRKRIEASRRRVDYWTKLWTEAYSRLKAEVERFKKKEIIKPKMYEYARITKDQRVYARVKKKAQTPEPVCEVSVSVCFKLPYLMTNQQIEEYVESEEFKKAHPEWTENSMREDINEILYACSFKAGRSHKVWRESVYAEQQYEAKGIDKDEVVYEGEKRFWLKFYRPETEYSHETIVRWISELRAYYHGKPKMLTHIRRTTLEEYM